MSRSYILEIFKLSIILSKQETLTLNEKKNIETNTPSLYTLVYFKNNSSDIIKSLL